MCPSYEHCYLRKWGWPFRLYYLGWLLRLSPAFLWCRFQHMDQAHSSHEFRFAQRQPASEDLWASPLYTEMEWLSCPVIMVMWAVASPFNPVVQLRWSDLSLVKKCCQNTLIQCKVCIMWALIDVALRSLGNIAYVIGPACPSHMVFTSSWPLSSPFDKWQTNSLLGWEFLQGYESLRSTF